MQKENIKLKIQNVIREALREDIGTGDITTDSIVPQSLISTAQIIAKEPGVICGLDVARQVFNSVDSRTKFIAKVKDGEHVRAGTVIAVVSGPARGILTAERTVLNFLQRLSGIATLTSKFVKAAGGRVKVLDTRKTTPGLRLLEKYAVKTGGGRNHRIGLFDAVLIKDNHIAAVGGIRKALEFAKRQHPGFLIEVETKDLKQVAEAVGAGVGRIMLDNMNIATIKKAVKLIKASANKISIEVSGGITLRNVGELAKTGVDFISVGAMTHSAPSLDISLKVI